MELGEVEAAVRRDVQRLLDEERSAAAGGCTCVWGGRGARTEVGVIKAQSPCFDS